MRDWILAARKQSDLLRRATGIHGNDLEWTSQGHQSEHPPPGTEVDNLEELVESGAPVLVKLQSSLDPDRAISFPENPKAFN